jgi:hypothetical protein
LLVFQSRGVGLTLLVREWGGVHDDGEREGLYASLSIIASGGIQGKSMMQKAHAAFILTLAKAVSVHSNHELPMKSLSAFYLPLCSMSWLSLVAIEKASLSFYNHSATLSHSLLLDELRHS